MSAVAHYVAGVLDRDSMVRILEELCETASFQPGDCVQTLRGSTRGVIVRLLPDGRVAWQPDGSRSELVALPESLLKEQRSCARPGEWHPRSMHRTPIWTPFARLFILRTTRFLL
jgi:hypothetical protein